MRYSLLWILPLCLFTHLGAAMILLDEVMTQEEQKKTGVYRLTVNQKIELEAWLNRRFVVKAPVAAILPTPLSMSINIDNGKKIELSDNSIWEVAPEDVAIASVWITSFPVLLSASGNPQYPMLITNTESGEGIKARKAEPAAVPPPQAAPKQ